MYNNNNYYLFNVETNFTIMLYYVCSLLYETATNIWNRNEKQTDKIIIHCEI